MSCVHVLLLAGLIELSVNPDALWVTDSGSRLLYSVFFYEGCVRKHRTDAYNSCTVLKNAI